VAIIEALAVVAALLLASAGCVAAVRALYRNYDMSAWHDLPGSGRFIACVAIACLGASGGVYRFGAVAYTGLVVAIFGIDCVIMGGLIGVRTLGTPAKKEWLGGVLVLFFGGFTVAAVGLLLT